MYAPVHLYHQFCNPVLLILFLFLTESLGYCKVTDSKRNHLFNETLMSICFYIHVQVIIRYVVSQVLNSKCYLYVLVSL